MQQSINTEFREVQQFRQPWVWLMLALIGLGLGAMFIHGFYTQLYLGQPWGDRPMSDAGLALSALLSLLLTAGIALLMYSLKLVTRVDNDGVHIRFFPLSSRRIPFNNILSCRARKYRPIREYGGWGIRFSRRGRAYNVSGNEGVQLELAEGKPVLIGSRQAEVLAQAINRHL